MLRHGIAQTLLRVSLLRLKLGTGVGVVRNVLLCIKVVNLRGATPRLCISRMTRKPLRLAPVVLSL